MSNIPEPETPESAESPETCESPANPESPARKPISARQLAANRANAQKCTGPKTDAGKQRSRFNSLKHGLTAAHVCLPGESREDYDLRRQEYIDYFQPASLVEYDILDDLVANRWRKERVIKHEKCLVYEKFMQRRTQVQDTFQEISLDVECALAVRDLADNSKVFENQDRCENRVTRNIALSWKHLHEAILTRPPGVGPDPNAPEASCESAILQNETISDTGHLDPQPVGGATQPLTVVLRTENKVFSSPAEAG